MIIYIWWLHSNFQLLKIKNVGFFVRVILPFYARTLQDNCIERCVYVVFLHLHLGQQHCRWIFGAFIQFSFVFHILGHLLCLENKPFFNWQICFDLGINIPSIGSCLIVLCSTFVCCTAIGYLVNISSMSIDQLPSVSKTYQDVKIFRYLDVKIFIYPNIWRIYQAKQQASNYPVSQLKPIKFALCLETTLPIVSQSCSNIAGISIHLIDWLVDHSLLIFGFWHIYQAATSKSMFIERLPNNLCFFTSSSPWLKLDLLSECSLTKTIYRLIIWIFVQGAKLNLLLFS